MGDRVADPGAAPGDARPLVQPVPPEAAADQLLHRAQADKAEEGEGRRQVGAVRGGGGGGGGKGWRWADNDS